MALCRRWVTLVRATSPARKAHRLTWVESRNGCRVTNFAPVVDLLHEH